MALTVNTNLASLNAQNSISQNQASLSTAMQRLSSGMKINSAADNAAGYAISQRMTSQINGNTQAASNANDAISLTQTAQGDLSNITSSLQQIRTLAVQAANASNSASDRAALNNQASQLVSEITRVASNSSFNGVNLLDGSFNAQSFQVGANASASDTISIANIASAKASALGVGSGSSYATTAGGTTAVGATALTANSLSINGHLVGAAVADGVSSTTPSASGIAVAAAINAISGDTGVTAKVGQTTTTGTTVTALTTIAAGDVKINGVDIGAIAVAGTAGERGGQVASAINAITSQTGVTATFDTTTGAVALNAADGRNIDVTTTATGTAIKTGLGSGGAVSTVTQSKVSLSSSGSTGITVSDVNGNGATASGLTVGYTAATTTVGAGVSSIDLTTAAGASSALTAIDKALQQVATSSASLGAYQNRFTAAVTSLQTDNVNTTASRSRITDADFAAETANLSRAQVLQQAGTAMLAQANQSSQGVLSLLR
jgi:flagellin